MAKKQITTEDLAVMVNKGFADINGRMKKGFDEIDKRFDAVDKRFDAIEKRIELIEAEIRHINARLHVIEHDIADIRKHFVYRDEFEDALARIRTLEKRTGIKSGK